MKKLLVLFAVVGISLSAAAQNYNYGLGVRLGYSPSLDFKLNMSSRNSLELNLNFPAWDGISMSAAYQWNWAIGSQGYRGEGFNGYIGPGINIGAWPFGHAGFLFGLGAHGGVEYKLDIPLAIAIDYKPMFTFATNNGGLRGFGFYDFAFVVRYAF